MSLRLKQIMPAAPGWRVLRCDTFQDGTATVSTFEMIGWGLEEDSALGYTDVYPLIYTDSVEEVGAEYVEGREDIVFQPTEEITDEIKQELEQRVRERRRRRDVKVQATAAK